MKKKVLSEKIVTKKYGVKNKKNITYNIVTNFLKKCNKSGDTI